MSDISEATGDASSRPWLNIVAAVILILATLADIMDEVLGDLFHSPIQAEHGLLLFGLLHLGRSVVELRERAEKLRD